MEELQEKLRGNGDDCLSVDSLEHASVKPSQSSWASLGDVSIDDASLTCSARSNRPSSFSPRPHIDPSLYGNGEDSEMRSSSVASFHLLPPIEENSEPSTTSSSSKSEEPMDSLDMRQMSVSCHNIYANERPYDYLDDRFKLSISNPQLGPLRNFTIYNTLYPLEPREVDPESFYQLHTADSLEELQEFLLLESQCSTNDASEGLAAAFLTTDKSSGTNQCFCAFFVF